jgi:hypothetical protein
MPGGGIIWGAIICIPFWLIVILLVTAGVIALETYYFCGINSFEAATLFNSYISPKYKTG